MTAADVLALEVRASQVLGGDRVDGDRKHDRTWRCPSLMVAVPRAMPLAKNSTVPVAVPAPGLVTATAAVSVTDAKAAGFELDTETVVVVAARTTANELTAEVLPA